MAMGGKLYVEEAARIYMLAGMYVLQAGLLLLCQTW